MLLFTLDICNKLDAEYWADWGTLLGVQRHRGVIPWDWDFDISLRTPDYKKMLTMLGDEGHKDYGWRFYN